MKDKDKKPWKHHQMQQLTKADLDRLLTERIDRITDEFKKGFDFIKKTERTVTFFGSARTNPQDPEAKKAYRLAKRIVEELDYAVVTGGGPGIMGAANCGAADWGGKSVGLTIKLPMEQRTNLCVTDHMDFRYFFSRKVCLSYAAEAYLYFPGGFGTMDELFEILTLVQTNKMDRVPIVLVGEKYWKPLDKFIKKNLLKTGKIDEEDIDLYTITDNEDKILEIVKNAPVRLTENRVI